MKKEECYHHQLRSESGKLLGDPAHVVMVNGRYEQTNTLVGQVIHDIMTKEAHAMLFPEIRQSFSYLKDKEKGR